MDNHQIHKIAVEARKISPLTIRQLRFILNWYDLIGTEGKEFGFRDGQGLEEQVKLAVNFLLETEREWQAKVLDGELVSPFIDYFESMSIKNGITLPDNFSININKIEKGWVE